MGTDEDERANREAGRLPPPPAARPELPEAWDLPRCSAYRVRPEAFGVWELCMLAAHHTGGHLWPSEDSYYDPERDERR